MKRVLLVTALAIFCWLGFGARDASWARQEPVRKGAGQPAQSMDLRLLQPGTKITVYLVDGSRIEGVLSEVQDAAIVVKAKDGDARTILFTDIKRLETKSRGLRPVTRVLLIVGASVGALLVVAAATC
jgi:hypothetical protein